MSDNPLRPVFARRDLENFANNETDIYGAGEDEPLVVIRLRSAAMVTRMPDRTLIDYVVRENNAIYVGNKHWMLAGAGAENQNNSECRGGGAIRAGGEMMLIDDTLFFNLGSGTYMPGPERAAIVHQALGSLGLAGIFLTRDQPFPGAAH